MTMNQLAQQIRKIDVKALSFLTAMLFCVMFAEPAMAQGLTQVNTLMDNVLGALRGVSIAAVTIAVILTGYRMAFKGESLADCAPVIIGGIIIGASTEIAQLLLG
jgi:type IV secretion system protein VirB2